MNYRKNVRKWDREDLLKLYDLRKSGKSWKEISKIVNKVESAARRVYLRTNWDKFLKSPDTYFEDNKQRKWSHDEMVKLDSFLKTNQSYSFIADQLNRTIASIEKKIQETDWKSWREISFSLDKKQKKECKYNVNEPQAGDNLTQRLVSSLVDNARHDFTRLYSITEDSFLQRINLDKESLPVDFGILKIKAEEELERLGYKNPEEIELGEGTYIIVGDSHGKHTKKDMFRLLRRLNAYLNATNIIHIGHILDDDNDISYEWGEFKNLIVLSKEEELRIIQDQRFKYKFSYDVVRDNISLGNDLVVFNQDIITDYVNTSLSSLSKKIFDEKLIVNSHRLEFESRCVHDSASYTASPGCICEDHISKTIKQINFKDGKVVKQAFHDGFLKYRRMKHMYRYWDRGVLIVNVDSKGNHTIVPCLIQKTGKGFSTSYFDKIITEQGVFNPDEKIFVNGDIHSPQHDPGILDIQEQICKDYKPTKQVNIGDTFNYSSLNHHLMDRGIPILNVKILDEAAQTHYILKRISKWAKESHLIFGNHERFAIDFVSKYPQFGDYLGLKFICDIEALGYKMTLLKDVLKIGDVNFIHGDLKMYGQSGNVLEKASKTFGKNTFLGHIHYPAIRNGCYSVGLTGMMKQGYNEENASRWMAGFGLCNQFGGKSWPTTIAIIKYQCSINGKTYRVVNANSWKVNKYSARLSFDF